jgi:hypothetical protein
VVALQGAAHGATCELVWLRAAFDATGYN